MSTQRNPLATHQHDGMGPRPPTTPAPPGGPRPPTSPAPPRPRNRLILTVPPGAQPGSHLRIKIPDGRTLGVDVPRGATPGTKFAIEVPPIDVQARLAHLVHTQVALHA